MANNGWREVALGHLGDLKIGVASGGHDRAGGLPIVKVKDFGDNLLVPNCGLDEIDGSGATVRRSQMLRRDDIVLIRSNGNSERLGLAIVYRGFNHAATFSNCCFRLRPDTNRVDPLFLAYFLRSPFCRQKLSVLGCATGLQNLSRRALSELSVPLPPLSHQRAIANTLSIFDKKIELNRRMNDTLEAITTATFKSWFVDFDPVRGKNGRRGHRSSSPIADLFPDHLVDSDLGLIPEHWQVLPIREITEGVFDGVHASPLACTNGPVLLGLSNLTGTRIDLSEVRCISEEQWPVWTENVKPEPGDMAFAYEAAVGRFALIPPELRCCLGRRVAVIRPRRSDPFRYFLFHSFVSAPFQRMLAERSTHGVALTRLSLREFPTLPILWPPARVRSLFDDMARSIWDYIHKNQKESRILVAIRDAMLPRLLAGKVRIPECAA